MAKRQLARSSAPFRPPPSAAPSPRAPPIHVMHVCECVYVCAWVCNGAQPSAGGRQSRRLSHSIYIYSIYKEGFFSIYKEGFSPSAGARQSRSHVAFAHIASIKKGFSIYKEGF